MLSRTKILTRTLIQSSHIRRLHSKQVGIFQKRWNATSYNNKKIHHQAEKNVVISKYPDIVIPNCTVADYIWEDLDNWADKTAMVCGITGKSYKYGEMYKLSMKLAASLRSIFKLKDNDCVALMLPNCPDFPLATIGAIQAGCYVTMINPIYTSNEISHQLLNSKAKVIITSQECCAEVKKSFLHSKSPIPIIITDANNLPNDTVSLIELLQNDHVDMDCLKSVNRTKDDTVFLPYSSGTTGVPKGVELLNKNILANFLQIEIDQMKLFERAIGENQDVTLCVLPFFHIYGLTITMLSKLSLGVKIVTLPKFTPETYLNAQAIYKANVLYIVPALVLFLSANANVTNVHLDSIRAIVSGAAPLAESDANRLLEKTKGNIKFSQGFGMTETSPAVILQERGSTKYSSVGHPISNTQAKIVDIENENKILGPNEVGELYVRGPQVMKGYFENPEANKSVFTADGWLKTGDMAYYDDERDFYITDRLKELIKVSGFQVAPAELEAIIRTYPDVSEAVVVGVPHERHGEMPKAFVVKKKGTSPSAENIMKFVAEKVASYKKLGDVVFIDSIPKNAAGKILRKEIKSKYT